MRGFGFNFGFSKRSLVPPAYIPTIISKIDAPISVSINSEEFLVNPLLDTLVTTPVGCSLIIGKTNEGQVTDRTVFSGTLVKLSIDTPSTELTESIIYIQLSNADGIFSIPWSVTTKMTEPRGIFWDNNGDISIYQEDSPLQAFYWSDDATDQLLSSADDLESNNDKLYSSV